MRKAYFAVLLVLAALLIAFGTALAGSGNFRAHLSGGNEVPAVDTHAVGQAVIQFNSDETELHYKLIVANIDDVFASHIHCAPAGVNGSVGVTLYSGAAAGPVDGILAQATVTAPNPGNACGWVDLADVAAAIRSGGAYVNVHTTGTPSGEIRGQVH